MPKKKFALESDGPQCLEIKWIGGWFYTARDVEVFLDGNLVGVIPHAEFGAEKEFHLPDDSNLRVSFADGTLRVFRDGKSLDLIDHPLRMLGSMANAFLIIAVCDIFAALALIFDKQKGTFITINLDANSTAKLIMFFVCGLLFFLLALWARQKSHRAVILGILLIAAQIIIKFILEILENSANFSSILFLIAAIFLIVMAVQMSRKSTKDKLPVIK
jgi:uncharacterized membrane protein